MKKKNILVQFLQYIRQVWESFLFAWQALSSNLLRTTLSLLGVTIGIFAIIAVFTIVDSLERTIKEDISFIGDDVIYIQKFPIRFGDPNYPWWKYMMRPSNTLDEYRFLEKNVKEAQAVALLMGRRGNTAKYKSNSISDVEILGVSDTYPQITNFEIAEGRYFTAQEGDNARNVVVIGANIAETIFRNEEPVGKIIRLKNRTFTVIGVMKKEGTNIFGENSLDNRALVPFGAFGKLYKIGRGGVDPVIALKARSEDVGQAELMGELTGLMRAKRSLKPFQEDNFALNRSELFAEAITSLFGVITTAGWVIGSFSILVGAFGIANIMFVTVKERTNLIGIQKSLGAKNFFILFQFLFEAVLLSLVGGLVGLGLVYLITFIPLGSLSLQLSFKNVSLGLFVASIVGIVSGVIPAYIASRLDPVEAIRSN